MLLIISFSKANLKNSLLTILILFATVGQQMI